VEHARHADVGDELPRPRGQPITADLDVRRSDHEPEDRTARDPLSNAAGVDRARPV